MIKLAVVGVGIWGTMHVRAYKQHTDAEVVAICDLDATRAHAVANAYGIPNTFTDIDALLNEDLDGISIATPDAAHTEIVLKAAAKGLHILVEKPLATTIEECERMVAAAEQAGVILMVDWHNRWNPPYVYARDAIRAGELGDVRYIYYRLSDTIYVPTKMLPWAGKSSVMWFLGSHALDTVCWLMGSPPVRIYCQKRAGVLTGMGIDTADYYVTLVDFENGAMAVIENNWIIPQTAPSLIDHQCEIIGAEGVAYLDLTHNRSYVKYTAGTKDGFPDAAFPDMTITPHIHGKQMGFAVESLYHFVDCVRDGRTPLATGRDGLLNTRLILAAEASARTGVPIDIGQDALPSLSQGGYR